MWKAIAVLIRRPTNYFSTHGCERLSCAGPLSLDEPAFAAAAAAWRALMSKKLAILYSTVGLYVEGVRSISQIPAGKSPPHFTVRLNGSVQVSLGFEGRWFRGCWAGDMTLDVEFDGRR